MPAEYLSAINTIVKLIPGLKSFTGQRRRQYFESLITPLYCQLEHVHDFYSALLRDSRNAVRMLYVTGTDGNDLEHRVALSKIAESFAMRRYEGEDVRGILRREAQAMLGAISWPEERRFLFLVCQYFMDTGGLENPENMLDLEISQVIEDGGNKWWDTPSARTLAVLHEAKTPAAFESVLVNARNSLNQRYMDARLSFSGIKSALALKT